MSFEDPVISINVKEGTVMTWKCAADFIEDIMFPPVESKKDFLKRFKEGEFGNRGPVWDTLEEYQASGYEGLVHLRNRVKGGSTCYNVPKDSVEEQWQRLVKDNGGKYFIAAMAPHARNLIQGEVCHTEHGVTLFYSSELGLPMRDALAKSGQQVYGFVAGAILQANLCPNSRSWMATLLERYPGHTVEFSCFSCNWGTIPGYNTVFWEVRNY